MNNGLSRSLGMVLLAAAVFAAAGCTAQGSHGPTSSSPSAPSPSGSAFESPAADPTGSSAPAPSAAAGATAAPADPSAPSSDPQQAPAPTFAPSEQQYLASRVPKGIDPNAVLQVGQERCAQLETVKATDQKAVVSHLIEKRGVDVVDAIAALCPGLQPELDAAGRGFTDGDFTIGAAAPKAASGSISAGKYEAWNPSPSCTLAAYDAGGGTIAESNGSSAVTIPAGAVRVVSDGCYTWLAV
jgi:hypothetical protein